jgi:hypothetical protein
MSERAESSRTGARPAIPSRTMGSDVAFTGNLTFRDGMGRPTPRAFGAFLASTTRYGPLEAKDPEAAYPDPVPVRALVDTDLIPADPRHGDAFFARIDADPERLTLTFAGFSERSHYLGELRTTLLGLLYLAAHHGATGDYREIGVGHAWGHHLVVEDDVGQYPLAPLEVDALWSSPIFAAVRARHQEAGAALAARRRG